MVLNLGLCSSGCCSSKTLGFPKSCQPQNPHPSLFLPSPQWTLSSRAGLVATPRQGWPTLGGAWERSPVQQWQEGLSRLVGFFFLDCWKISNMHLMCFDQIYSYSHYSDSFLPPTTFPSHLHVLCSFSFLLNPLGHLALPVCAQVSDHWCTVRLLGPIRCQ